MSESKPDYGSEARSARSEGAADRWDAGRVRRLRGHLGATQSEFAERLGTRQQTVSEWETGASRPRAMARRLLHLVAEERGFYSTEAPSPADPASPSRGDGRKAAGGSLA
jgi:DNA-binding transcriptional regulator YiaG